MGLFKRATDVLRANLNELIEGVEDPEKMIKLYLEDAREHLVECKKAVHTTLTAEKTLQTQYDENQKEVEKWQKRAETYVTKGDDALAKEALTEKKKFETRLNSLKDPLEASKRQSQDAMAMVEALQERIRDTEANSTVLIARAQTAKAMKKSSDSLAGISSKDPLGGLKNMESKIEVMEASAHASAELAEVSANTPEKKFKDLEAGDVDSDLVALKEKMKK
jgi:phage shock protein A